VSWVDGWPVVGELAPTMAAPPWPAHPLPAPAVRDDFDGDALHPRWIWVRSRPEVFRSADRPGWLTMRARGAGLDSPDVTFVGRRQQHQSCRARTLVDATAGRGGLAVRIDEAHHYEIEAGDGQVRVLARA
jgi:beta-xylosidase